jgi:hypothetical protein
VATTAGSRRRDGLDDGTGWDGLVDRPAPAPGPEAERDGGSGTSGLMLTPGPSPAKDGFGRQSGDCAPAPEPHAASTAASSAAPAANGSVRSGRRIAPVCLPQL